MTMGEIEEATDGRLVHGARNAVVRGLSTDSRTLKRGDLFVALCGANHDGHDHLKEVQEKGAGAVVIQKERKAEGNVLRVKDTLRALGDIAHYWRKKFLLRVVGVTGSNGKTTAKDMVAAVLASKYRTLKTEGNFNNLIGLPLTIGRLKGNEDAAVLEMGMNHFGEIDRLAEIAEPSVALITNVGRAHLEGLGGLAGVAKAKAEILGRLPRGGAAVLPADNRFFPYLKKRAKSAGAKVISFGFTKDADFRAMDASLDDLKGLRFRAKFKGRTAPISLPIVGRHNILNALAALAVGDVCGVPIGRMRVALRSFHGGAKRMEIVQLPKKVSVINDCYNANPDSMAAALDFLKEASERRRSVAVLGDMLELGAHAAKSHRETGERAARAGVSLLFAVGPHAEDVVQGARSAGLERTRGLAFRTAEEGIPTIRSLLRAGDLVLVKGSRGMKMERVTEALKGKGKIH